MKRNKWISKLFFVIFSLLITFLTLNLSALNSRAASTNDYTTAELAMRKYDGITNWKLQNNSPSNEIGEIPIGNNISLGYTFGAARNANGTVTAGDTTITKKSTVNTSSPAKITNSKINVFLDYKGKYYGIIHQGANSYIGTGGTPENASDTSIDYALLTNNRDSYFYNDMNLLANMSVFDSSSNASKQFYTGTDANGKPVYKLLGLYGKQNLFAEIVLRPSITGAPIVQRELYVYNPDSNSKQFQTFFGEDTGLNPNNNDTSVDNVPMYSMGGGKGLYLLSGTDYDPASKLFITNEVSGGFKDFMGRVLTNPTNWGVKGMTGNTQISDPKLPWLSSMSTSTDYGDTDTPVNTNLLKSKNSAGSLVDVVDIHGFQDSAYTLRWPEVTLNKGDVAEFSSTVGATIANYAIPRISKTYTNLTSPGSTVNHVGDKLRFTLTVKNDGYKSTWLLTKILDNMPAGLTIDKSTTQSSLIDGDAINFNPNTSVSSPDINGNKTAIFTFDATVNNQAPYNLTNGKLTNTAYFTGNNINMADSKTDHASVDIPVEMPTFKYRFTKQVRNDTTDPNGSFSSKTTGKKDDTIEYKVAFNSNGTSSLSGANFADSLPDGLELIPDSVSLNGTPESSLNFSTGALKNNVENIVSFKAKVTGITASTASNTAYLNNVLTNTGQQFSSIATEVPAEVDIQDAPLTTSFVEVPNTIDFGSVNSANLERTLPNVSTDGKLIVTHSADTPFQVSVSYDNNGDNSIVSNGNKLIQDDGDVLLFNQAQNDNSDNWRTLSTNPVPIKSDGFSGSHTNYDLTNYIGSKKWKIRVPANSKAGVYNGQVTWSIADTL